MNVEDYLYRFLTLYNKAPKGLRLLGGKVYNLIPMDCRYGKVYRYNKRLLQESPYWNDNQKRDFIFRELKNTLINAYENTKYYRESFDQISFSPYNFKQIEDILVLPFTDKHTLREHKCEITNFRIPKNRLIYVTTGGTSGVPVEVFYIKGRERSREFVFMTSQWERIGYRYGDKIAILRGTVVDYQDNNTYFKYEPIKNRLFLSTYDLYEDNFPLYIQKLKAFKPDFLHTYPSAVIPLAKYIVKNGIQIERMKGIFCSSEQFYPAQRDLIEEAFKCRVYSWYGHTEYATLAGECEINKDYHIFFEYGYTELIDEAGNVITKSGIQGEIVGTSFEMKGFPIIRYRTGDYAQYVGTKCSCGRNYELITGVKGRWEQEQIITKKKSTISITALNMHSDIFNNVVQFQFHQKKPGEVTLRIKRSDQYSFHDEEMIKREFRLKLKDLVNFQIEYVEAIKRTPRGKHKFLIQELNQAEYK